jgi:SAM-dependent methyltransferase
MRAEIPPRANAVDGTAESIPLADGFVDAVTVGQAYHWFDPPAALAEMARVLRPEGTIGLFWNTLDDSVPWVAELAEVIAAEERASYLQTDPRPAWTGAPLLSEPEREIFAHAPLYDGDRLEAFIVSRSQTILMPAGERASMLERVRAIMPGGQFALPLVCEAWRGTRRAGP